MSEERAEMAVFLMQERHEFLSGLDAMRLSAQQELGVVDQGSVNFQVVGRRLIQGGEELSSSVRMESEIRSYFMESPLCALNEGYFLM